MRTIARRLLALLIAATMLPATCGLAETAPAEPLMITETAFPGEAYSDPNGESLTDNSAEPAAELSVPTSEPTPDAPTGEPAPLTAQALADDYGMTVDELADALGLSADELAAMPPESLEALRPQMDEMRAGVSALAAEEFVVEDGVLTAYNGEGGDVVVPDSVTRIGARAFEGRSVRCVTLPDGLTAIDEYAFNKCNLLVQIDLPDSLTSIGKGAFCNCQSLSEIQLPDGLTGIADFMFDGCGKLQQIAIPGGVTRIGAHAFDGCRSLTRADLSDGLKSIGEYAFNGCDELEEIVLPNGLTAIEDCAFYSSGLTEIIVPDSVTSMGSSVFSYTDLTAAMLPRDMSAIPAHAFAQCYQLQLIVLPDNLTVIGNGAFANCQSLTMAELPSTLREIGKSAFWTCTGLVYVNIPASVTKIGESAFAYCDLSKLVVCVPKGGVAEKYCWENELPYTYNDSIRYIEFSPASVELMTGETFLPDVYVDFPNAPDTIKFSSSNKNVASVDPETGEITAKRGGTAKITAKSKNGKASASMTVKVLKAPDKVGLSQKSLQIALSETAALDVLLPDGTHTTLSWASSNPAAATVDENGVVTALALGDAVITVTTHNGKTASCAVSVRTPPTAIRLEQSEITLGVKQTGALIPVLEPENAFEDKTFTSSDVSVVAVNSNGALLAKKAGTAVVTVETYNGLQQSATITVLAAPTKVRLNHSKASIGAGQTLQLTASTLPEGAHDGVAYASSNPKIATVDENGLVTALKPGTVKITARTYNGKKAVYAITVKKAPTGIRLSADQLTLGVGEAAALDYALPKGTASTIEWRSSDNSVATVADGKITPMGAGTAVITAATYNGLTAECAVTVKPAPTQVQLSASEITLSAKQTAQLNVTLLADGSADCAGAYAYKSSNSSVVSVSASGKLTARKAGTAIVRVQTYDESVYADCAVTVIPEPKKVRLNASKALMGAGETLQLVPQLAPAGSRADYRFTSSKSSVATVSQDGLVTALQPGTAKITVRTHNGKKAVCTITVRPAPTAIALSAEALTLGVGEVQSLSASLPGGAYSAIAWSSSDESVASVSGGKITANGVGTALVTAATSNGLQAACRVTVKPAPTEIVLSADSLTLGIKQTAQLNANLLANGSADCAGSCTYRSSKPSVVSVSETGKLLAKRAGSATITVVSYDGQISAACTVRVIAAPKKLLLSETRATIAVGESLDLTVSASPYAPDAPFFTHAVAIPSTADTLPIDVVQEGNSLRVLGVAAGQAKVTVKSYNGKKAVCLITVE